MALWTTHRGTQGPRSRRGASSRGHRRGLLISLLVVGLMVGASATPASAGAPSAKERHCTVSAATSDSPLSKVRCYATFAEAISAATGGRVKITATRVEDISPEKLAAALSQPAAAAATYVRAILYTSTLYGGSSLTFTASSGCSVFGNYDAFYPNFQSPWNNNFSSGRTFSGCRATLYDSSNYGGAQYPMAADASYTTFGAMDNAGSSLKSYS